jgi:hypothetical protein
VFADEVRRRILSRKERIERKEVFGSSGKLASGVYEVSPFTDLTDWFIDKSIIVYESFDFWRAKSPAF